MKSIGIKIRKLMTMNGRIHPRRNVGRLYLAKKKGGRRLAWMCECESAELEQVS